MISGPVVCGDSDRTHCYVVEQKSAYKMEDGTADIVKLTTSYSSASCGVSLAVGDDYLVSGNPDSNGSMGVHSCGFSRSLNGQSDVDRAAQDSEYASMSC